MSVSSDFILERIRLKSSLRLWKILSYLLILIVIFVLFAKNSKVTVKDSIARVEIKGEIHENYDRVQKFSKIEKDKKIKAMILHINSPGGGIVGAEEIYESVREIAKHKPVVVTMGTAATSAAYYAALAGDMIFARQGTLTGSIGVKLQSFELTKMAENLGIKFLNFKSSSLKAVPHPTEKVTPEVEKYISKTIDDNYRIFYELVKNRRKIDDAKLKKIANGRVFTGTEALKNGLIDSLGGQREALNWLFKEKNINRDIKVSNYEIKKKKKLLEKIVDEFGFTENSFFSKIEHVGLLSIFNLK